MNFNFLSIMPEKLRKLIIGSGVLAFLILTPLIILYSYGYRYSPISRRFTQTGNLHLNSAPPGADVIINGRTINDHWYQRLLFYKKALGLTKIESSTPTLISHLIPNIYNVSVNKSGYQNWQKKLEVKAGQTTFSKKINLFLEQSILEKTEIPNNTASEFNHRQTKIIVSEKTYKEIYLIDGLNLKSSVRPLMKNNLAGEVKNNLSEDGAKISIVDQFGNIMIVNLDNPNKDFIKIPNISFVRRNRWTNNGLNLYFDNKKIVYDYDLNQRSLKILFNPQWIGFKNSEINDWLIDNNFIYLIAKNQKGVNFYQIKKESGWTNYKTDDIIKKINLPDGKYQLENIFLTDGFISIKDKLDNYYFINIEIGQTQELTNKYFCRKIIKYNETAICFNDWEIIALAVEKENDQKIIKNEIVLRESNLIKDVAWYDNDYIIYANSDRLIALELDNRDYYYRTEIIKGVSIEEILGVDQNKNLYFMERQNNKNYLVKIKIQ